MVVGHNLLGFELEVLLARATALKVRMDHGWTMDGWTYTHMYVSVYRI